ncbi:MAG: MFS transporter, partial [Thermomicrobiales bacterium]
LLPRMIFDLGLNTADIDRHIWIVNAYLIAYLVSIPIVGRLSDRVGRSVAFQVSFVVFILGSILCATADSLTSLIIARAVQGAGGGALLPLAMALVGDLVPRSGRTAALGLVAAADTVGWAMGPIWGAIVIALPFAGDAAWRAAFWINVPLSLAAMIGIAILMPRRASSPAAPSGGVDLVGTCFLAAGLTLVSLALSSGGEIGGALGTGTRAFGGSPNPLADYLLPLLVAAAVAFVVLVWWERRAADPIVPLALFRVPDFAGSVIANFLVGLTIVVAMVNIPLVVALTRSSDDVSTTSALLLVPFTGFMALMSWAGGRLAVRLGNRKVAWIGLVLAAAGYAIIWQTLSRDQLSLAVRGLTVAGAGFGLVIAPIGASALGVMGAAGRGIGTGLLLVARLLGMTIGISTLTAFGIRRLQQLTSAVDPIVLRTGESTAEFLIRQQQFIEDVAIPLSVQVIEETFLIAAVVTLLALLPVAYIAATDRELDDSTGTPLAPPATD